MRLRWLLGDESVLRWLCLLLLYLVMWETGASLADHHETAEIVVSLYQFKGRG